jgi:hypothetical protein
MALLHATPGRPPRQLDTTTPKPVESCPSSQHLPDQPSTLSLHHARALERAGDVLTPMRLLPSADVPAAQRYALLACTLLRHGIVQIGGAALAACSPDRNVRVKPDRAQVWSHL